MDWDKFCQRPPGFRPFAAVTWSVLFAAWLLTFRQHSVEGRPALFLAFAFLLCFVFLPVLVLLICGIGKIRLVAVFAACSIAIVLSVELYAGYEEALMLESASETTEPFVERRRWWPSRDLKLILITEPIEGGGPTLAVERY